MKSAKMQKNRIFFEKKLILDLKTGIYVLDSIECILYCNNFCLE